MSKRNVAADDAAERKRAAKALQTAERKAADANAALIRSEQSRLKAEAAARRAARGAS